MTNPSNIVRVRARNGGRASVYEANAWCQAFSSGLLDGTGVIQSTTPSMNVLVGGSAANPDVVIASNPSGYKIALDIVGQQSVAITAPASSTRISAIVAYTDDLSVASTETTTTGSPASCGLIVVNGTAASSPVAPSDSTIRAAITSDGATGSQACYAIIATITVSSATTTITDSLITTNSALMPGGKLQPASVTSSIIDWTTFPTIVGSGNNICYKFPNGIMIASIKQTSTFTFSSWGEINESSRVAAPNFAAAFTSKPTCVASIENTNLQCWIMNGTGANNDASPTCTATKPQDIIVGRSTGSGASGSATFHWLAIGTWQ